MADLDILRVPVLNDNYVWLVHDPASDETLVVDPAVAAPVLAAADAKGWRISQIWNTHWHGDHIGGNAEIVAVTGAKVTAPAAELARIPNVDRPVGEGDRVRIGDHEAMVMSVPAHTGGHIAYHFAQDEVIFVGDTMFAMGCGRLFEGTAEQMYANMRRFEALPDATRVYCAHEYTLSNGKYALRAEPDNPAVRARVAQVEAMRARNEATVPTTIGQERATNPFLRADSVAELARRRAEKDKG
ncbi:hydroxyacylglutathione hydrolase [Sphingobium nicotianae]|uniref:Hydroxyacylglutathione hydrolase n=1 Tax=Sphingobium nicotianae TaxID=2782607 RepID=A0A9X1DAA2_9SPHN|nr:hydroxyacylglutathione hydrolase [Sphingobium nicotianae]MBT2186278.1 hydroxyacylglutathione hydrolase [Sphingobium nicotianae]